MAPKPKRIRTHKKGSKTKNKKKAQPLPDIVGFFTEEDEPKLKEVLNTIGLLAPRVRTNELMIARGHPTTVEMAKQQAEAGPRRPHWQTPPPPRS